MKWLLIVMMPVCGPNILNQGLRFYEEGRFSSQTECRMAGDKIINKLTTIPYTSTPICVRGEYTIGDRPIKLSTVGEH